MRAVSVWPLTGASSKLMARPYGSRVTWANWAAQESGPFCAFGVMSMVARILVAKQTFADGAPELDRTLPTRNRPTPPVLVAAA